MYAGSKSVRPQICEQYEVPLYTAWFAVIVNHLSHKLAEYVKIFITFIFYMKIPNGPLHENIKWSRGPFNFSNGPLANSTGPYQNNTFVKSFI